MPGSKKHPCDVAEELVSTKLLALFAKECLSGNLDIKVVEGVTAIFVRTSMDNRESLRQLYIARDDLKQSFKWSWNETTNDWAGTVMDQNSLECTSLRTASDSFEQQIKTWQPLMDGVASVIHLYLALKGHKLTRPKSMYDFATQLRKEKWEGVGEELRAVILDNLAWYDDTVRPLRNAFVHNQKQAFVIPEPGTNRVRLEISSLSGDSQKKRQDLDEFVNWICFRYFLFIAGVVEIVDST